MLTAAIGAIGYFFRRETGRRDREMAEMSGRITTNAASINEHKVYAANTYAKESALTAAIREFKEDVNASLKDIRDDIKTILRQTK